MSASDIEDEDSSNAANGCQDFHNALNDFRHQNVFCDVTVYGDNDDNNEEQIFAHSIVLAAGSEVLKDTLTLRETNIFQQKYGFIIKIDGITSSIWKLLLDFLYLRRLAVQLSPTVLKDLYLAAKVLGIRNLVSSLGSLISSMDIDVDMDKEVEEVNVKLSPRVGVQERAVQVDDLDPEVDEEDASPRRKKKFVMKIAQQRKRRAAEEYDNDSAEIELDEDDEEYTPSKPKSARKKLTQKIRNRVKSRAANIKQEKESPEKEERKEFKCVRVGCGALFDTCQGLFQHHFTCIMADSSYKVQEYALKDEEDGKLTYADPFMMEDGGVYETFATEMRGTRGKAKGTWYQCGHCERQDQGNRMVLHLAFVHGKRRPLHCKECDHKYRDMRTFVDHYLQEHTPVVFTCVHCYQSFENRSRLKRHVTDVHINMGQPTHECRGCGKMFKYAGHARRHETYHRPIEERRVHPCVYCGKKFLSKADLTKHELTHQTEKPFKCQQCNYSTQLKSNLTLHERTHGIITANYMCTTCGRYYLYQHSFKNHLDQMGHEGKHVNDLTKEETERLMQLEPEDEVYEDVPAADESLESLDDISMDTTLLQSGGQTNEQVPGDDAQTAILPEEQAIPEGAQAFEIHFEANPDQNGGAGEQQATLDQAQLEQLISQNIQEAWTGAAQGGQSVVYAVVE